MSAKKQFKHLIKSINKSLNNIDNSLNNIDRQTIPRLKKTSFNDYDNKNITRNIKRHNNKHIHITYINNDELIYGIPIEQSNCSTCKIRNSTNS